MSIENENEDVALKNSHERGLAHSISDKEFDRRLSIDDKSPASDTERRIGAYVEMLEPQVREAIIRLVEKGYTTTNSGYHGLKYEEGVQFIGFEKGTIDKSILAGIEEYLSGKGIEATFEETELSDYIMLKPQSFLSLDEWKEIWNAVAVMFPQRDAPAPFRETFINKRGH